MSMMIAFLGNEGASTITAEPAVVSRLSFDPINLSIVFTNTGVQQTIKNGNTSTLGNWVTPPTTANQWEIRASVASGSNPTSGTLNTWQDFSTNRTWSLSVSDPGLVETFLTFEFRKVGGSSAEFTITGSSMSGEVVDLF